MDKQSKYPLCRFLQERTGKSITQIAEQSGIRRETLWEACVKGKLSLKTLQALLKGGVPLEVLKEYIDEVYRFKADRLKSEITKMAQK